MTAVTVWSYARDIPPGSRGITPGASGTRPYLGNRIVDASAVLPSGSRKVKYVSQASRPVSTGQLPALRRFHFRPITPVVCWGPYQVNPEGRFISGRASRLDAFSGYPFQT